MAATEALYAEYGDRVQFIIIYTIEAHPAEEGSPYGVRERPSPASRDSQGNPLFQPGTHEERVEQARRMVTELAISVPVLIDEMDNPLWCTYGPAPDIAYFISTEGIILER